MTSTPDRKTVAPTAASRLTPAEGLLHDAAEYHDSFEKVAPPHDRWDWYAAYINARQGASTPDEASAAAGRYMAEVKDVVATSA